MIIGTAGHIDHGKSALVTALTGKPVDRLAEEKRRGITIDLNFAPLELDGLAPAGIVDVPGHEDFVRTMVAGSSGIDLVLLVVDAAQGAQPQTWEHLAIVEQLGVPRGIPVISKADLADPDWLALVADDLTTRLRGSPVAFELPAVVSAVTRQGIPELLERLRRILAEPGPSAPEDGFRMPIDRAFSVAGIGTVVTGTPWSGALRIGDTVSLLPAGLSGRVRSLEAYGKPVSMARPGARTAVGIAGIERGALHRGETLIDSRLSWKTTTAIDALVQLLPGVAPLRRQSRMRVHLGTAEVLARAYPQAGDPALVRLALEQPILARGNDRFVLRSYSPVRTIGGGRVLDPMPPRRASWPQGLRAPEPEARVEALVVRRPRGVHEEELPLLLGTTVAQTRAALSGAQGITLAGGHWIATSTFEALRTEAHAAVRAHHRAHPLEPGLSIETLRRMLRSPVAGAVVAAMIEQRRLKLADGTVALPNFSPAVEENAPLLARVIETLEKAGLTPPSVAELEADLGQPGLLPLLRQAAQQQRIVAVESDRYFAPGSLEQFLSAVRQLAATQEITPAGLREILGLSRKYLIPLLEWSDRTGVTRRVGDARVLV